MVMMLGLYKSVQVVKSIIDSFDIILETLQRNPHKNNKKNFSQNFLTQKMRIIILEYKKNILFV